MGLSVQPRHLRRYRDLGRLLLKYGRSDLFKGAALADFLEDGVNGTEAPAGKADELASDLERLGPTFIKLGQFLSTRTDLLPAAYLAALARLQDKVEPFPFAEVEQVVAAELGVRLSRAFLEFNATPLAAASLGQVHRAVLRDGHQVAVKVQRPAIRTQVVDDLEALAALAEFIDRHTDTGARYEFAKILDELRRSLLRELDYRREAEHLATLGANLRGFDAIVVPTPIDDYTTARVLTMDYVAGTKVTAVSPVVLLEVDGAALAEQLFAAYLKQILVDGFFHADAHPGNVLLTEDGRLALIDLGMVAQVTPRMQDQLLQLVLAMSEGRPDDAAGYARRLGEPREGFEEREFARRIAEVMARSHGTLRELEVGKLVLEVTRVSAEAGLRLPVELTMLGKALLNLDEVARRLDPEFDPNAAVRRHASAILERRLMTAVSPGNLFSGILEAKDFVERLPGRINKILDRVADNDVRVRVDALDQTRLMTGFQKVANRITLGLVLAALIVGAAMLMQVDTSFRVLGYPGLPIIFFLLAALGGVALIVSILFGDE